ncbi:MAG: T9SS type A sorting domain-containing protein [Ignavibacteria bacterium]|nr:T9SS type A sorting domain-containing protein [Ignavibacteria bacterium]
MRLMKTSYNRVIEERIEKRINEKIKGDKIGTYEKMSKKEIKNLPRTEKINLAYNRDEKTIISRANENLNILKGMSKEAKEKKYIEDLYLISKIKSQVVSDNVKVEEPEEYILNQNYPNPFNPTTKINFALPKQGFVTMKVYDILGRVVRTLVNEYKNAGNYITEFDGTNLSSGVYFYKLTADNFSNVKKMILIK